MAEEKKPTKVAIEYEGTTYTIEFNRESIKRLEDMYDFNIEDLGKGKVSKVPDLFYCGFLMHHPNMKRSTSDTIFAQVGDKSGLLEVLLQLYAAGIESVFAEPTKGKALTWKAI